MEIVTIEKEKAFEEMKERFNKFSEHLTAVVFTVQTTGKR